MTGPFTPIAFGAPPDWSDELFYPLGMAVIHNGSVWRAIHPLVGEEPGVSAQWTEVVTGGGGGGLPTGLSYVSPCLSVGTTVANQLVVCGSTTGVPVSLSASGSDTDVPILIVPQGAGPIELNGNVTSTTLTGTGTRMVTATASGLLGTAPITGSVWSSATTYHVGDLVIDRGGTWQATGTSTNSRPISGNTDWTLVAGTTYVDLELSPADMTSGPITTTGVEIIPAPGVGKFVQIPKIITQTSDGDAWDQDPGYEPFWGLFADGCEMFSGPIATQLASDFSAEIPQTLLTDSIHVYAGSGALLPPPGIVNKPIIFGNGSTITGGSRSVRFRFFYDIYETLPASSSFFTITAVDQTAKIFTVSGDATSLGVTFDVDGNTGGNDGTYTKTSTDHAAKAITGVNQGTKKFTVAGDQTARFPAGVTATVAGSTLNDGDYTVVAAVFGTATEIEVVEAIPDPTIDGTITANTTAVVVVEAIPFATADGWVEQT